MVAGIRVVVSRGLRTIGRQREGIRGVDSIFSMSLPSAVRNRAFPIASRATTVVFLWHLGGAGEWQDAADVS